VDSDLIVAGLPTTDSIIVDTQPDSVVEDAAEDKEADDSVEPVILPLRKVLLD
jgi:hypothetical protein